MYSRILQQYVQEVGEYAQVDPDSVALLDSSLACFLSALAAMLGAQSEPQGDMLDVSVRLLLLSDALSRLEPGHTVDGAHYLVGLGFEQTGELVARMGSENGPHVPSPWENDCWYRLLLAYLHYLAGGHRVQALSVLRRLQAMSEAVPRDSAHYSDYQQALVALQALYAVRRTATQHPATTNVWYDLIFGQLNGVDYQQRRLQGLARQIRRRRDVVLGSLGEGNEAAWLSERGVDADASAEGFWRAYLQNLDRRGITAFTREQVGDAGDFSWLRPNNDLLVVLPTGSGKTVVGELRSALTLAQRRQVIWILPTRALVRQIKKELSKAFAPLGVTVEELPTTEDFQPLFADSLTQRGHLAATTPEKLAALLRSNLEAAVNVGTVVFDEAQMLLTDNRGSNRGTTAEFVLHQLRTAAPTCEIVLMTAFSDVQQSLETFLRRLGRPPGLLVSDGRPSRKIYGVITNDYLGARQYPVALFYPPGMQSEDGRTERPYTLTLAQGRSLGAAVPSPTRLAQRFVHATAKAGVRVALFVNSIASTEAQARRIASGQRGTTRLPERDVARLRTELGRTSAVEETGARGVACHHAGLAPLEQAIVEKWLAEGVIGTVVATPTLAQGVNLPFDLCVVTYTSRFTADRTNEPLSHREIMNMLGRAGRAGQVSDGIGLLVMRRQADTTATATLDSSRRYFFHQEPSREHLGLSHLLQSALQARIDTPEWLIELDGLNFAQSQALISFALRATADSDDIRRTLAAQLRLLPSIQEMSEEGLDTASRALAALVQNIRRRVPDEDPLLMQVLERTGMPIEVMSQFLAYVRQDDEDSIIIEQPLRWADRVVHDVLVSCSVRRWCAQLATPAHLETVFHMIPLWRSGAPLAQLETGWGPTTRGERARRNALGKYLNHRLSLLAQFWGALAVCYDAVYSSQSMLYPLLQRVPAFTREGVSTLEELEWLYAIGGLDRVLAHDLAALPDMPVEREAIRHQVRAWREGARLPRGLREDSTLALAGVLDLR